VSQVVVSGFVVHDRVMRIGKGSERSSDVSKSVQERVGVLRMVFPHRPGPPPG